MTNTAEEQVELRFIAHSIAAILLVADVVIVFGLGFDYVVPVVLSIPQFDLLEVLTAIGILAFLVFIQILFLPLVAFLFDFQSEHS